MARELNVIQSIPFWLPLTSTWLYNQTRYLPEDVQSHIACGYTENLDQFRVPSIHSMADRSVWFRVRDGLLRRGSKKRWQAHMSRVARTHRADMVHTHFGESAWRDVHVVRRLALKHLVTFYGKDVNYSPRADPRCRERYRHLFANVDRGLCEGPHMGRCLVDLGCPEEKVCLQHLGVEVEQIPFRPRRWDGAGSLRVFMAASFREKKGIPDALEALGRIQGDLPGLEITIIGDALLDGLVASENEDLCHRSIRR